MAVEDYIDTYYLWPGDNLEEYKATCKYCGEGCLRWDKDDNGKWRLMSLDINLNEHVHNCRGLEFTVKDEKRRN